MSLPRPKLQVEASFVPQASGEVHLVVQGPFRHRALPIAARVGEVPVLRFTLGLRCFTGILPRTPQPGSKLFVRYVPEPELETTATFTGTDGLLTTS